LVDREQVTPDVQEPTAAFTVVSQIVNVLFVASSGSSTVAVSTALSPATITGLSIVRPTVDGGSGEVVPATVDWAGDVVAMAIASGPTSSPLAKTAAAVNPATPVLAAVRVQ
jgi:hypothetical protein